MIPPGAPSPAITFRHELARKSIHVASVVVPIAYARGLPRGVVLAALGALLAAALVVEWTRSRYALVRDRFGRLVGGMLRAHEHAGLSGATWMLAAFLLAATIFPRPAACAAMCAVSLGDASAAVVGRSLGRVRLPGARGKTLEGALACAAASAFGAHFVAGLSLGAGLAAGACAAAAELPARPLDDNVRVALAAGVGILLWRMTFY